MELWGLRQNDGVVEEVRLLSKLLGLAVHSRNYGTETSLRSGSVEERDQRARESVGLGRFYMIRA